MSTYVPLVFLLSFPSLLTGFSDFGSGEKEVFVNMVVRLAKQPTIASSHFLFVESGAWE